MLKDGLPKDFHREGIQIWFNKNSGNVFFSNEDYQVAMLNGEKLESFYSCPICGHEGFKDELEHNPDDGNCQEWICEVLTQDE